jgi:hypothetical protein
MPNKRIVAAVAVHIFETPVPGESAKVNIEIEPQIFIASAGQDFRTTASALRAVARQIEEQASPLVLPQSSLVS